jgi:hypothetical protein
MESLETNLVEKVLSAQELNEVINELNEEIGLMESDLAGYRELTNLSELIKTKQIPIDSSDKLIEVTCYYYQSTVIPRIKLSLSEKEQNSCEEYLKKLPKNQNLTWVDYYAMFPAVGKIVQNINEMEVEIQDLRRQLLQRRHELDQVESVKAPKKNAETAKGVRAKITEAQQEPEPLDHNIFSGDQEFEQPLPTIFKAGQTEIERASLKERVRELTRIISERRIKLGIETTKGKIVKFTPETIAETIGKADNSLDQNESEFLRSDRRIEFKSLYTQLEIVEANREKKMKTRTTADLSNLSNDERDITSQELGTILRADPVIRKAVDELVKMNANFIRKIVYSWSQSYPANNYKDLDFESLFQDCYGHLLTAMASQKFRTKEEEVFNLTSLLTWEIQNVIFSKIRERSRLVKLPKDMQLYYELNRKIGKIKREIRAKTQSEPTPQQILRVCEGDPSLAKHLKVITEIISGGAVSHHKVPQPFMRRINSISDDPSFSLIENLPDLDEKLPENFILSNELESAIIDTLDGFYYTSDKAVIVLYFGLDLNLLDLESISQEILNRMYDPEIREKCIGNFAGVTRALFPHKDKNWAHNRFNQYIRSKFRRSVPNNLKLYGVAESAGRPVSRFVREYLTEQTPPWTDTPLKTLELRPEGYQITQLGLKQNPAFSEDESQTPDDQDITMLNRQEFRKKLRSYNDLWLSPKKTLQLMLKYFYKSNQGRFALEVKRTDVENREITDIEKSTYFRKMINYIEHNLNQSLAIPDNLSNPLKKLPDEELERVRTQNLEQNLDLIDRLLKYDVRNYIIKARFNNKLSPEQKKEHLHFVRIFCEFRNFYFKNSEYNVGAFFSDIDFPDYGN